MSRNCTPTMKKNEDLNPINILSPNNFNYYKQQTKKNKHSNKGNSSKLSKNTSVKLPNKITNLQDL